MAKKKAELQTGESFGKRIARLRKAAGYTQRDLAADLGTSQRMVAYYEGQTAHPPAALLPRLAELLKVSADELLGLKPLAPEHKPPAGRLWRRFKRIEQLPVKDQREIVRVLDMLLDREHIKKASAAGFDR